MHDALQLRLLGPKSVTPILQLARSRIHGVFLSEAYNQQSTTHTGDVDKKVRPTQFLAIVVGLGSGGDERVAHLFAVDAHFTRHHWHREACVKHGVVCRADGCVDTVHSQTKCAYNLWQPLRVHARIRGEPARRALTAAALAGIGVGA